ncbi:MAG: antitoxin [Actinomycetota bacterium]|nr:antitoxin [Actinomycetota bacterium]
MPWEFPRHVSRYTAIWSSLGTKIFRSNQSQAVRLPKALEIPPSVREVSILAQGKARIIAPMDMVWNSWFDGPAVSADFPAHREQPPQPEREGL